MHQEDSLNVTTMSLHVLLANRCEEDGWSPQSHYTFIFLELKHDQCKPKNPSYLYIYLYGDIWEGFLFLTALRWVPKEKGRLVTHGSFISHLFMQKHIFWLSTHWYRLVYGVKRLTTHRWLLKQTWAFTIGVSPLLILDLNFHVICNVFYFQ